MGDLCLVTGGAGFIGSHLVEGLAKRGRTVRVLDDLSTGDPDNLAHITPAPELIVASVTDPDAVAHAVRDVDTVFHLAALASVQASLDDPARSHEVCATGTLRVLDAARRGGVRRVVYAGSASAYGIPAGPVQTECDALRALSPYAAAKLAGEFYLQAFAASFGLEAVSVRFFNIFGPRQRPDSPYSGVIARFVAMLSEGRRPTVHGDGLQSRDFTYVTDAVQALVRASEASGVSGRVYNVGTGRSVTVLELVAALNRLLGTDLPPEHGPPRSGDVRHSRADIRQTQNDLGYSPAVTFEAGLEQTLRWYRQQDGSSR